MRLRQKVQAKGLRPRRSVPFRRDQSAPPSREKTSQGPRDRFLFEAGAELELADDRVLDRLLEEAV